MSADVVIAAVGVGFTVVTSAAIVGAKIGRLDAKVDSLGEQIAAEANARVRLLEALTARVENLSRQFGDHAIQDAAHFGEIKGILGQPAQVRATGR